MKDFTKRKVAITALVIVVMVIILNIPIVSDVIAMARVGMIWNVMEVDKVEYEGKEYRQFSFDDTYQTRVIVVEHNILRATVQIFEDSTGKVNLYTKPLFGKPVIDVL